MPGRLAMFVLQFVVTSCWRMNGRGNNNRVLFGIHSESFASTHDEVNMTDKTDASVAKVFTGDCVRVNPVTRPISVPVNGPQGGIQIHVVREGNIVKTIEFACKCGQSIQVDCHYD